MQIIPLKNFHLLLYIYLKSADFSQSYQRSIDR